MGDLRLRGQEIQLRALSDGVVANEVSSNISSFDDSVSFEIKEDGFIGEKTNRFDDILNGYSGGFEFQVNNAAWLNFEQAMERRAKREDPTLVFNIIRTDLFANGGSAVIVYMDVKWGELPTNVGGRAEYAKVKAQFKCSQRTVTINQIL